MCVVCAWMPSSLWLPHLSGPAAVFTAGLSTEPGAPTALDEQAGVAREAELLRKGGIQVGQTLLLTKALGTGALLAAQMRLRGKGAWLAGGGCSCNEACRRGWG